MFMKFNLYLYRKNRNIILPDWIQNGESLFKFIPKKKLHRQEVR